MIDDERYGEENPSSAEAEAPGSGGTADAAPEAQSDDNVARKVIDSSGLVGAYTAGGLLKAAREAQELSIDAVSRTLMLNRRVIEALEQTIQPPGFDMRRTRIAAKSYAKYLGISADPVLADFPMDSRPTMATAIPRSSVTQSARSRRRFAIPAAVMGGMVVTMGIAAFMLTPGKSQEGRAVPSVAERVVAVNTAKQSLFAREPLSTASAERINLSIVALKPAWIEVRGPDGTIFRSRTMAREEVYYPRVGGGWTVTVKNGAAFEWRVDDIPVGRFAELEEPVYSVSVDEAASVALDETEPTLAAANNSRPSR
jgi:hypothetical protein